MNRNTDIIDLFCKWYGLRISRKTIKRMLEQHPFDDSLLAIYDTLTDLGFKVTSYKNKNAYIFRELKEPFITQVKIKNRNYFALVLSQSEKVVVWYNPISLKKETIDYGSFSNIVTDVFLIIENVNQAIDSEYSKNTRNEFLKKSIGLFLYAFIPFCFIASSFENLYDDWNLEYILSTLAVLVGYFSSFLLLLHEMKVPFKPLRNICRTGTHFSCNSVLSSKASHIWNIPWSVIGCAFYEGIQLTYIFFSHKSYSASLILCVLAIPYICYSLYYQSRVIRKWCPLCLLNMCCLIILVSICFMRKEFFHVKHIADSNFFQVLVCMIIMGIIYYYMWCVNILKKKKELFEKSFYSLKNDPFVFWNLLSKEDEIELPAEDFGIYIGNPQGSIHVLAILSPFCSYCSQANKHLQQLALQNEEVYLQIVFAVNPHEKSLSTRLVDIFLSLYYEGHEMDSVLNNWYKKENRNIADFLSCYDVSESESIRNRIDINAMYNFCRNTKFNGTPAVFVNRRPIPRIYNITELKYFIV